MMPNITRGGRMSGLMVYLAGGGRHNEHQEQHLVAGNSAVMTMYGYDQLDAATALQIAHDLDEPRTRYEVNVTRTARVTDPETGAVVTGRVCGIAHCHCAPRRGSCQTRNGARSRKTSRTGWASQRRWVQSR